MSICNRTFRNRARIIEHKSRGNLLQSRPAILRPAAREVSLALITAIGTGLSKLHTQELNGNFF